MSRTRAIPLIRVSRPEELIEQIFASPFVSDSLCKQTLGYHKNTADAALKYLEWNASRRPEISIFFDREFYNAKYPDLHRAGLDPFLQFMSEGCGQRRSPHPLVDTGYITSIDKHLLPNGYDPSHLFEILQYGLADPSPYFSIEFYRKQVTSVTEGFLAHFLTNGLQAGLRPNPLFDPLWYYKQLDGNHNVTSGLRHFVLFGDLEGRASSADFNGRRYLDRNPDVVDCRMPALAHYLTNGKAEGRPIYSESSESESFQTRVGVNEDAALSGVDRVRSQLTYQRAKGRIETVRQELKDRVSPVPPAILRIANPVQYIKSLALLPAEYPKVSILVPVYNELSYTVECIGALIGSRPATSYEVIVADDASTDGTVRLLKDIENIKFLRQQTNIGFLANCNAAFKACSGDYVLLLNNDAQLMPGALDALVEILEANPDVAAVGPKILYPDGRLQEAGCTLDRDGISTMVGLFADPYSPEYNRDRDVHYCSGAALLLRRNEIGDVLFDETFRPAYCEDADLCLRLLSRKNASYTVRALKSFII